MASLLERLSSAYPDEERQFIYPTTKAKVLEYLHALEAMVESMEDFDRFPEGSAGVVLHAVLVHAAFRCADVGDVSHALLGFRRIMEVTANILIADMQEPFPRA